MRVPLTLKINGGSVVTDRSLRLKVTSVNLRNQEADEVAMQWLRKNAAEVCPLADEDVVDLYIGTRRIFRGRVLIGTITPTGVTLKLRGPWSYFDEYTYHQNLAAGVLTFKVGDVISMPVSDVEVWDGDSWVPLDGSIVWTIGYVTVYDPGVDPYSGTLNINRMSSSRVRFFQPASLASSVFGQLTRLVTFFDFYSEGAFFDVAAFELGDSNAINFRTVQDLPISEAIRQVLAVKPEVAIWWDYEISGLPVMYTRTREAEDEPLELVPGAPPLAGYGVAPMTDTQPSGVVLRWEYDENLTIGQGKPWFSAHYPTETAGYQRKALVQTAGSQGEGFLLAQPLYEQLSTPRARGSLSVMDLDFSLGLRPGRLLALTDDDMLTTYVLTVQAVAWNPDTGLANLTVGYPAPLNLQSLQNIRQFSMRCFYPPGWSPRQLSDL